ncbi:hypothetical protein ATANTOWER_005232 [Ataeniobius toweri]|uniref:Uncharacterized protein n=1 Tax=Ataeniobius toweri TaxID=208326 RepID=A0ABU7BQV7_9TELE|nr:hypothetical protein [Ataeniobius toweri]
MAGPPKCKSSASIRICTLPQTNEPKPQRQPGSQAAPAPPRHTTMPTTMPNGKTLAQQTKECHRKATACTPNRLHHNPPDAEPPTSRPAKLQLPPSQRHRNSDTTHPSICLLGHDENHQPQVHTTHQEPPSRR